MWHSLGMANPPGLSIRDLLICDPLNTHAQGGLQAMCHFLELTSNCQHR